MRKMFADNCNSEFTIDTKFMGKFFTVKDEGAGPDDFYPYKLCYQPAGILEQVSSTKSKSAMMKSVRES